MLKPLLCLALFSSLILEVQAGGRLISHKEQGGAFILSKKALDYAFLEFDCKAKNEISFNYHIKSFQLIYETTNPKGEAVEASALILLRSDIYESKSQSTAWVSYQHGARVEDDWAPSNMPFDAEALGAKMFFAREGHLVVIADYLGLGVNKELQSYMHGEQQAQTTWDALVAAKQWAEAEGIPLGKKLFLTGYSQGGYVTLALQKKMTIEKLDLGIPLIASIPMAGIYDFGLFSEDELDGVNPQLYGFLAFMIVALSKDPKYEIDLYEILDPKFHDLLDQLLARKISTFEFATKASDMKDEFYTADFFDAVLTRTHPVYRAVDAQGLLEGWKPNVPTYFFASPDDEVIPFKMSQGAYESFKAAGVEEVFLGELIGGKGHIASTFSGFKKAGELILQLLENPKEKSLE